MRDDPDITQGGAEPELAPWHPPVAGADGDIDCRPAALVEAYDHWAATRSESDFEGLLDTLCEQWDALMLDAAGSFVRDALEDRFPLLAEEARFWSVVDALSAQDDAYEQELEASAAAGARGRAVLRVVGVLLVVFALLVYFVVPFGRTYMSVPGRVRRAGVRPIPVAPERDSGRRLPV